MREGASKLLAACSRRDQALEASKSLLTCNARILALLSQLQRMRKAEILQRVGRRSDGVQGCIVCVCEMRGMKQYSWIAVFVGVVIPSTCHQRANKSLYFKPLFFDVWVNLICCVYDASYKLCNLPLFISREYLSFSHINLTFYPKGICEFFHRNFPLNFIGKSEFFCHKFTTFKGICQFLSRKFYTLF